MTSKSASSSGRQWADDDDDSEMSDAPSVEIITEAAPSHTSQAPRFPPEPTTPTPSSRKGKKRAAAAAVSPHVPRAGPGRGGTMSTAAPTTRFPPVPQPEFSPANPLA